MAVVWAKQNGNWSDTTLWAFWNETTQQIEDYGQIPQNGDVVYLNSYTVTMNADINIGNGIITNKINPYTQQYLGYILDNTATARNITSNIEGYLFSNGILSSVATGAKTININGNVKNCTISIRYSRLTINGNVEDCVFNLNTISHNIGCNLTINGNFLNNISSVPIIFSGSGISSTSNFTINGNITDNGGNYFLARSMTTNVSINGNFMSSNTFMFCSTELRTFLINGIYSSIFSNWVITRQLYVGENTHFILTDRNNIPYGFSTSGIFNPDYPSETDVKINVPYAFNQMVGTYDINQYLPPESVVLSGYEYDTITAEENDIAIYNAVRYIYADYGTLHWFELKTTTTDIVTTPSQQSITIGGETVVADTDYVVEYNDVCYQWSGSVWGSITTKNIGTVKTDIVTNPTETTLAVKKGTLETIPQATLSRMQNALTVDIFQQILDAHLNN